MPAKLDFKNAASTVSMIVPFDNFIYLVQRKHEPFKGKRALPGGFLNCDQETLEQAGVRELFEETRLEASVEDLRLLCVNSDPKRDPRGHVIDHIFIVTSYSGIPEAADDADDLKLFSLENLPELAFDHKKAIDIYKEYYKNIVKLSNLYNT